MTSPRILLRVLLASCALVLVIPQTAAGAGSGATRSGGNSAAEYWTPERMARAEPRDLVVDHRGLGYLRRADGSLRPHGHQITAVDEPTVRAKPDGAGKPGGGGGGGDGGGGGGADTTGPVVSDRVPAPGATIGTSSTFSATVTDASGVRSVSVAVVSPSGQTQSFAASAAGDTWSVTLQGFTDGVWSWYVVARDGARKGGNTSTSTTTSFTVETGSGGAGTVANEEWIAGGEIQTAAGRIYFEMGNAGYVCSGTVVTDSVTGRSIILTAAHCVYDDVGKAFATNVLFIPDQASGGSSTDTDCGNDPLGCWEPAYGVVDLDWTSRTFPDNIPWDYGYYVVGDDGHVGAGASGPLDAIAGALDVQFTAPVIGERTHALGYSYSDDPDFMYCAESMGTNGAHNYWLASCGLSGGSSGGPWVQPMDVSTGSGPIISVNSWGYARQPGMAGPKLAGTSASCLFTAASTSPDPGSLGGIAPTNC